MTLQYCSDLHLDFPENAAFLRAHPIVPQANVLVLAGDVVPFTHLERHAAFFDAMSASFEAVYWLPGNHEYYGSDILRRSGPFREAIRSNVFLLNNQTVDLGDTTLILSTLWSRISPAAEWEIAGGMGDYRYIRNGMERFRPLHSNRLHGEGLDFIKSSVAAATGNVIVATHHVPTFQHYPEQHRGSSLNQAFATELFPFIEDSGIAAWIYGHHHSNIPEFAIGSTRMCTNQLGYVDQREQAGYRDAALVEI